MLDASPRVGPFSLIVARPYSFLDVGLDFQARKTVVIVNIKVATVNFGVNYCKMCVIVVQVKI